LKKVLEEKKPDKGNFCPHASEKVRPPPGLDLDNMTHAERLARIFPEGMPLDSCIPEEAVTSKTARLFQEEQSEEKSKVSEETETTETDGNGVTTSSEANIRTIESEYFGPEQGPSEIKEQVDFAIVASEDIAELGETLPAFSLEHPTGTTQVGAADQLEELLLDIPGYLKIRTFKKSTSKKELYQVRQEMRRQEYYLALKNGHSTREALILSHVKMKGRCMAPFKKKTLRKMFIADANCERNMLQAILVRHFGRTPPVTLSEDDQKTLSEAAFFFGRKLAEDVPHALHHIDIEKMLPNKKTANEKVSILKSLVGKINHDGGKSFLNTWRKMFVKPNECLSKPRARGIQCGFSEDLGLAHQVDAGLIEKVLFKLHAMKKRSIKYATPSQLNYRVYEMAKRFEDGGAISIDFGSWDSRIRKTIRDCIENCVVEGFLGSFEDDSGILTQAYKDRVREILSLKTPWHNIEAAEFGRQSGDRGTSVLNYITNLFMVFLLYRHLELRHYNKTLAFTDFLTEMETGDTGVDYLAEGDDLLLFLAKRFLGERKETTWRIIRTIYEMAAMVLEPQVEGGRVIDVKASDSSCCIRNVKDRMEFVSRVFIYCDKKVVSVPKLTKSMNAMAVTFSSGENIANILYSTALSGMVNQASSPMLRAYWTTMRAIATNLGGSFKPITYYEKKLEWAAEDNAITVAEYVQQESAKLRTMTCDETVRDQIAKEHPNLTVELQERIESLFAACASKEPKLAWQDLAAGLALLEENL